MATDETVNLEQFQKVLDVFDQQKNLLKNCSALWKTLSCHFSSMHRTLESKFEALEAEKLSLDSQTEKTLESLDLREKSIPDNESEAIAHIELLKEAALLEFEKQPTSGNVELKESVKSYCRKMDSGGLLSFLIAKKKLAESKKYEISEALADSVDPPRLVLDAIEDFLSNQADNRSNSDKRLACGLLIHALFPVKNLPLKLPFHSNSIVTRAAKLAEMWKSKIEEKETSGIEPAEVRMFLLMVMGFRIFTRVGEDFVRRMVVKFSSMVDMSKIAFRMGFGEKMEDIIEEIVKNGKELDAIYFSFKAGLVERFPPNPLLKTHIKKAKKHGNAALKNRFSATAKEEVTTELKALKATIKCVQDHNLESKFPVDSLRNRISTLEKLRFGKRTPSTKKSQKRSRSASSPFPRSKAFVSSVSRPDQTPRHQAMAASYPGQYSYPDKTGFEGPVPPSYGGPPIRNGAGISQHPYAGPDSSAASYGGQPNYGGYDYNTTALPNTYPSYPH